MPHTNVRVLLLSAALLGLAATSHARFTRIFGPIQPMDNLSECSKNVKEELSRIDRAKSGPIHFDCHNGFVRSLYLDPKSEAAAHIDRFVAEHWKLLDTQPVMLMDAGGPFLEIIRRRNGLPFHSRDLYPGIRPLAGTKGSVEFFDFDVFQEPEPGMSTNPKSSARAAERRAILGMEEKRGSGKYSVEKTELVIRDYCSDDRTDKSVPKWPNYPQLTWWVRVKAVGSQKTFSCFVDAKTGDSCYWNNPCGMEGPFEL